MMTSTNRPNSGAHAPRETVVGPSAVQRALNDLAKGSPRRAMIVNAADYAQMPEPELCAADPGSDKAKDAIIVRFAKPLNGDPSVESIYLMVIEKALSDYPAAGLVLDFSKCSAESGFTSLFISRMGSLFRDKIQSRELVTLLVNPPAAVLPAFSARIQNREVEAIYCSFDTAGKLILPPDAIKPLKPSRI